jgi:hypothetical protein
MTKLRNLVAATALAAGVAVAGAVEAAPPNAGNIAPPVASEGDVATPVHDWQRRCWPARRWVWTHWGWRYRAVGHRCAPRHHYRPYYHY